MVKYLLKTVNTYRVHTVTEVEQLHEELKHNPLFELTAFSYTTKDIKVKGDDKHFYANMKIYNDKNVGYVAYIKRNSKTYYIWNT